ncbi:copper amine oxidase family protein [Trema orientale]|uniref:Copper amine oxidase family protein n=1 Tax=Trema orientale TaxID=63057 RepID=A0A2P5DSB1_TREOI|nr:copper amine oxidase family protein [Trema orientale]
MAARRTLKLLSLFMAFLLLHNFGVTASSRPIAIHSKPPKPPSTVWFSVNHYKINEADAFRPTTPGHSPGVGHESPPST